MGSAVSVVRRGLWGYNEEPPRVKRRCVRRNLSPSTGSSLRSGTGGSGTGSGSGTSSGSEGSNDGGSSGSGSGSSGGSGSGSSSGSAGGSGGGDGSGSSSGSSSENGGGGNSTGSGTSNGKGNGGKGADGNDESDDGGDDSESGTRSAPTGTSPSPTSTKKFFQAVAGSTGGANSTNPYNTSMPTDEYGSPLPNPTSMPPNSDDSDTSGGAVVGGGRPSTGTIIAIVGGILAGLAVLLVLAWLGHRAWKRREEKRLLTKQTTTIPPLFMDEGSLGPLPSGTAFTDTSTLISHEKGLAKSPAYPFPPGQEADSSAAVHEMPSRMPETIRNRHELATPDILEIPDFGNLDLDITDHEGDGDDMGIRRPTSLL
ncbi:hypothetical protein QBC36DRAFT_335778 [Triangularia setosa]|uniref:Uncharacterized protein n=1 Tax=Triangularia setosa TaxID=2587417 RepID=A0AAN6W4F3_9PEZI|nr:hypothetical protein QBC36DRAFT_335778 [Podospora setosa]